MSRRDDEYTQYVAARLTSLRRLATVLCGDWQRADDLVQATLTTLYLHWGKVRAAEHADAYARAVLVREFIHERRSSWSRRVTLGGAAADRPVIAADHDAAIDLRAAVASLPPRQRATLVLRFYCDLNVDQSAAVLGCSAGTVKSQTARALESVRRILGPGSGQASSAAVSGRQPAAADHPLRPAPPELPGRHRP